MISNVPEPQVLPRSLDAGEARGHERRAPVAMTERREEERRGEKRREEERGADSAEERNPRAQPGMAVPQGAARV